MSSALVADTHATIWYILDDPRLSANARREMESAAHLGLPIYDLIFFDFESGNFDGWTLTGDRRDKQPASTKTFVDKSKRSFVLASRLD